MVEATLYEETIVFDFDMHAVFNDQRAANFFIDEVIDKAKRSKSDVFVSYVSKNISEDRTKTIVTARFVSFPPKPVTPLYMGREVSRINYIDDDTMELTLKDGDVVEYKLGGPISAPNFA